MADENKLEREVKLLGDQIKRLESQLEAERNRKPVVVNSQEIINEKTLMEVANVLKDLFKQRSSNIKLEIQEDSKYQMKKLETVNQLDSKEKWFKGTIIFICILALVASAFFDKLFGISPVIGVIIGAVLAPNVVSEFLSGIRKQPSNDFVDD